MAWKKEITHLDRAVAEVRQHWPDAALGNFAEEDSEKTIVALLEVVCRLAEVSPCRESTQSVAGYASSLLWASHLERQSAASNAHGMVEPLRLVLTADPMATA